MSIIASVKMHVNKERYHETCKNIHVNILDGAECLELSELIIELLMHAT